jgi:hypothetical protein
MSARRHAAGLRSVAAALALLACSSPKAGASGTEPADLIPDPGCTDRFTRYVGDCQRPPPVDPSVGVLAHYGPRDYDNPDDVAQYVMPPSYEGVDCVYSTLSNDADVYYQHYKVWSRPGTHHVILSALNNPVADGTHDDCELKAHGSSLLGVVQGAIGGSAYEYPPPGDAPPENSGLGTRLPAHQAISYELHAVNATEGPLLRENWTIFYFMPDSAVTTTVGQMAFNGGLSMNVQPHSQQVITNSCQVTAGIGNIRIVDAFAHMHSHGKRFSAFIARGGNEATRQLIYESYDWSELDLIEFNSKKQNTPITYQGGVPGGISGDLYLAPGDRIEYECAIDNTEDFPLTFQAKAFTGEMCNMFGSFTPGTYWSCIGN